MSNSINPDARKNELSPIRIMVVDDNEVVRRSLELFIGAWDEFLFVGEAADGDEAISLCAHLEPDLILMDINMPGLNGIEATRIIHERHPDVLILAISGLDDNGSARNILKAGADNYISKQTSAENLAQAIFMTVGWK